MNRLKEKYLNEVVSSLMNKYNYKSIMEVPKLEKIVINMGVGDATGNSKLLDLRLVDKVEIEKCRAIHRPEEAGFILNPRSGPKSPRV